MSMTVPLFVSLVEEVGNVELAVFVPRATQVFLGGTSVSLALDCASLEFLI
jgi:hypothetical protein